VRDIPGAAYLVDARQPDDYRVLHVLPVLSARIITEQNGLVLSDFITRTLLGGDGELWRSPRLCWDDLRILQIEDGVVSGVGYARQTPRRGKAHSKLT
jgi:hypothetical protein